MRVSSEADSGLYYDRLTGRRTILPETEGTLVGRWRLYPPEDSVLLLNSAIVREGDFLVPEESGVWSVLGGNGSATEGAVFDKQLPEELVAQSLRAIGDRLALYRDNYKSLIDWWDVVPLELGNTEKDDSGRGDLEVTPFEEKVRAYFGHVEAVCLKPRAHLHVEIQRMPVSKARRVAPQAGAYLASHTEDWDSRLIRGILPKRILAEVRDDQIDIYENRVAKDLLDRVTGYLNARIGKLRLLLKTFEAFEQAQGSKGGTHQRRRRIMVLWGKSIDANEGRRQAEDVLGKLEWLKYKFLGLRDSPLYRNVPRRSSVQTTLRMTNILANDQHYRRVAELWRELPGSGKDPDKNPEELHLGAQELCRGMDSFSMLLVVRALEMLGYEPQGQDLEAALVPGATIRVEGHGSALSVGWQDDGTILVETDKDALCFLPLALGLGGACPEDQAQAALERICNSAHKARSKVAVLYAASVQEPRGSGSLGLQRALRTVGNDRRASASKVGFLPVSPWEIGSTERVARALRWFVMSERFSGYPWRIDVPSGAQQAFAFDQAKWLAKVNGGAAIELIRPPQDHEWVQLGVRRVVQEAEAALKEAEKSHGKISKDAKSAYVDKEKGRGEHQRRRRESTRAVAEAEKLFEATKAVARQLDANHAHWIALLKCPTCGKRADAERDFEARGSGCFRCLCSGCGTEWATRLCGAGHKYATMLPSGNFKDIGETEEPGWEDHVYGCDLLAVPARTASGEPGFSCPDCGEIT